MGLQLQLRGLWICRHVGNPFLFTLLIRIITTRTNEESFKWSISNHSSCIDTVGQDCPATDTPADEEGFYMYIAGKSGVGIDAKPSSRITSSEASSPISECIFFYYNLKEGGISSLSVKTLDASEKETLIWKLQDISSTGEWHLAQVETKEATRVVFEVEAGESDAGFAAVDEILVRLVDICTIEPTNAAPGSQHT